MNHSLRSTAVALLATAAVAPAQIAKGAPAPAFEISTGWNAAPAAFDEFEGKLVILDFAQTW